MQGPSSYIYTHTHTTHTHSKAMYEGVIHGALPQPWSFNNSPPSVMIISKNNINNMSTTVELRASCEYENNIGSHIDAEDFFIDDLSEFSNEDIAAPIKSAFMDHSSLQQELLSDDNTTSASNSKAPSAIKSDCTTANTSTSGSVLLHGSPAALDYKSSLHIEMDSSLSLPCQDGTGFEWLSPFGDDNLIYGASNFGMDSFLLSNAEPFGGYDGLSMKHGEYEDDSKMKDIIKEGHTIKFGASTNDEQGCCGDHYRWDDQNGVKDFDAMMFMLHSTGSRSARTKRARSALGWSSSNILCNNCDKNSPTNSLNSTSQIMPNPPYSSPTFLPKQEENDEHHGYTTHPTVELITSSLNAPNRDKPFSKASKFPSNNQALNDWAKLEEENTRDESVSNYGGLQPRRCTHCLSQKTPQWRAGPEGPKTLCNACGVRHKSGRLFDEYRPAKSPTFLSYKHSNSHKKVMEMRRRKTLQYNSNNNNHQQQQHAAHHTRTPPPPLRRAEVDPHLGNKLKTKLNPSNLEPHSHFSDVTLISTRTALESPSCFLY